MPKEAHSVILVVHIGWAAFAAERAAWRFNAMAKSQDEARRVNPAGQELPHVFKDPVVS